MYAWASGLHVLIKSVKNLSFMRSFMKKWIVCFLLSLSAVMAFSAPLSDTSEAAQRVASDEASHVEDEISDMQSSRGKMRRNRAVIVQVENLDPAIVASNKSAGAIGGKTVWVRFKEGPLKGQKKAIQHLEYDNNRFPLEIKKGDTVLVGYLLDEQGHFSLPQIYANDRSPVLIVLILLFIVGVLVLGRMKGAQSLLALLVTILFIFLGFIPLVIQGVSPLLLAITVSVLSSGVTFLIISGFSRKTLASTLGVLIGFVVAAVLVVLFGNMLAISGVMNSHVVFLKYTTSLNIHELIFAGILIGAIGAVMDVAISMASTVEELSKANPDYTATHLFTSSLNVGRDMLGTMVNTLILAYVGASLPFLILIYLQYTGTPIIDILNLEIIAEEILRSIIGSTGMLLTIPATAFIAALLTGKKSK